MSGLGIEVRLLGHSTPHRGPYEFDWGSGGHASIDIKRNPGNSVGNYSGIYQLGFRAFGGRDKSRVGRLPFGFSPSTLPVAHKNFKELLLMIKILHYLKDPELWESWHIPYSGQCRIYIINRIFGQLSKVGSLLHSVFTRVPYYTRGIKGGPNFENYPNRNRNKEPLNVGFFRLQVQALNQEPRRAWLFGSLRLNRGLSFEFTRTKAMTVGVSLSGVGKWPGPSRTWSSAVVAR